MNRTHTRGTAFLPEKYRVGEIKVVKAEDLDAEIFHREYWLTNTPVLIKGAVKHWRAHTYWRDTNYLLSKLDNPTVKVRRQPSNQARIDVPLSDFSNLQLEDLLRELCNGSDDPIWVDSVPLRLKGSSKFDLRIADSTEWGNRLSALADLDFADFSFLKKYSPARLYPSWRIFLYKNSFTDWHPHGTDTHLLCQIFGDKEVLMFPANEGHRLLKPLYDKGIRSFEADENLLNDIKKSKPHRVVVEDGDALHIPVYWYHAVRPLVKNNLGISVVHAFGSPLRVNTDERFHMSRDLYQNTPARLKPLLLLAKVITRLQRQNPMMVD
jgi:hypothetical protein